MPRKGDFLQNQLFVYITWIHRFVTFLQYGFALANIKNDEMAARRMIDGFARLFLKLTILKNSREEACFGDKQHQ